MEFVIDNRVNLTNCRRFFGTNTAAIRSFLESRGYRFADANRLAMFTVYGFRYKDNKNTLSPSLRRRLSIHDRLICN